MHKPVVVITRGRSGIGAAIAWLAAQRGTIFVLVPFQKIE